jgi:hypothetical protein
MTICPFCSSAGQTAIDDIEDAPSSHAEILKAGPPIEV